MNIAYKNAVSKHTKSIAPTHFSDASSQETSQSQLSGSKSAAPELTIDAINALLDSFGRFGVDLGLDRILQLLENLGNPHHQVPVIHVAGTNGKGSVCAYVSSVLLEAGYRVGRYISPHLVSWCERFCINDDAIAPDDLYALLTRVRQAIRSDYPSPTQFELVTAAAFLYFAQQKVDVAVMEVGLGGRLDATNVCDRPLVSVITSISREHWQRLGPTVAAIAGEKAGILKPHCPAIIGQLPAEAKAVVRQRAESLECETLWVEPSADLGQGRARYPSSPPLIYSLPLPGAHQRMNSAVAIATIHALRHQGWSISDAAILNGLKQTRWPGRIQWATWRGHPLLIDGAHNPAAAAVLRQYVDESLNPAKASNSNQSGHPQGTPSRWNEARQNHFWLNQPQSNLHQKNSSGDCFHQSMSKRNVHWVMGMLSTKDHADIFKALLRDGDRLSLVPVPEHRSADPYELAQLVTQLGITLDACECFDDAVQALDAAFQTSQGDALPGSRVVLCGSLYLIGWVFQRCSSLMNLSLTSFQPNQQSNPPYNNE